MKPPPTRESVRDRVFRRIEKRADGHWIWHGRMSHDVANTSIGMHTVAVPRIVWELEGGPSLAGVQLRQKCTVPGCVAPACHQRTATTHERGRTLASYFEGEAPAKPYLGVKQPPPESHPGGAVELKPIAVPPPEPKPVAIPPGVSIVGPFKSGGIVVFTPWGTFNGELVFREEKR